MAGLSATAGSLVPQPQLAARLRAALERGSVGLVGGAGNGKTRLVEEALAGRTVAWLSCRDHHTTVDRRLIDAQRAAIGRAAPGAAGPALSPLDMARALLGELGIERSGPQRRELARSH